MSRVVTRGDREEARNGLFRSSLSIFNSLFDVDSSSTAGPVERARELVLLYGWNSTAYQIINPGITLWFSAGDDAVIGYVSRHGVRVVAGAPVCGDERLAAVTAEFEEEAAVQGERVCYFCAEERLEQLYRNTRGHTKTILGAQPAWDPAGWNGIIASRSSLRAQLNRARNKGVSVAEWPPERATRHPKLLRCLDEWLDSRGLPPLRFLVEPDTLERLFDRKVIVAERSGEVVGFLVASPIPLRNGWLIEQIIRGEKAPNGTAELMIDAAMRMLAADGADYVTLGLSPLSWRAEVTTDDPFWLRLTFNWIRAHGTRFYNFQGLESFKAKFRPDRWEPVFAISTERRFSLRTLYAVAAAFSSGSPVVLVLKALVRAVGTEITWLRDRMRKRG
jgi:phosphatidylglycerol lysyltransferase